MEEEKLRIHIISSFTKKGLINRVNDFIDQNMAIDLKIDKKLFGKYVCLIVYKKIIKVKAEMIHIRISKEMKKQ